MDIFGENMYWIGSYPRSRQYLLQEVRFAKVRIWLGEERVGKKMTQKTKDKRQKHGHGGA